MPFKRQSRKVGERVVRRVKRDGTAVEYRYPAYTPHKPTKDTINALIQAYQLSPEWAALSSSTRTGCTTYLRPLLASQGNSSASVLQRRDILGMRDVMLRERGHGAANGFLDAVTALFRWAVDREWITHSPVQQVKRFPKGSLRAWTRAEADLAERMLPRHLARVVMLARHTGQRRGDLCSLTWTAYDGASIRLTQQKTKTPLVIPLSPAFCAELDRWRSKATAVTILTNWRGRPWSPGGLSHILPIALAEIGLGPGLNIHGLRKLAATELADAGCTAHEIAAITGHRTLAMVQHYTRTADQERLASAAILRLQQSYNLQNAHKKRR